MLRSYLLKASVYNHVPHVYVSSRVEYSTVHPHTPPHCSPPLPSQLSTICVTGLTHMACILPFTLYSAAKSFKRSCKKPSTLVHVGFNCGSFNGLDATIQEQQQFFLPEQVVRLLLLLRMPPSLPCLLPNAYYV